MDSAKAPALILLVGAVAALASWPITGSTWAVATGGIWLVVALGVLLHDRLT